MIMRYKQNRDGSPNFSGAKMELHENQYFEDSCRIDKYAQG